MFKNKADTLPEEFIDDGYPDHPTVERWLKDREIWNKHSRVYVQFKDFIVDRETHKLFVNKTAWTSTHSWVGGSVTLRRIHDGWLRAEFDEGERFRLGEVTKHHQIVNILYKLSKVDDTIPVAWWNET